VKHIIAAALEDGLVVTAVGDAMLRMQESSPRVQESRRGGMKFPAQVGMRRVP
jgi:hypothetical protein